MSRLPFELLLALRYLRPKRTYVSIITLISIIGVMLGVAVLIIVISVMSGFDRQLREKILGFNAHIKIYQGTSVMTNYPALMKIVTANPLVKGVAPFVLGPVLIEHELDTNRSQTLAPWLRGLDPRLESKISILPDSIIRGRFDLSRRGLLVGSELARQYQIELGDTLSLYSARSLAQIRKIIKHKEEEMVQPDDYVVRGIFDVGYYEYNASVVFASLADAQDLYDLDDAVHGLLVMLKDASQAPAVRTWLRAILGPDYTVKTWAEENSGILNALRVEKNVMFYILFFIMVVAAFGITGALITFVVQKTREIGMLKALGATSVQVMWLFLSQSFMVGVFGVASGFGLGMLALSYRNEFLHFMNRATGFELFPASIYNFDELPALIISSDIALICGGSFLICILAGVLPAWNAGRLKPVEALRYE